MQAIVRFIKKARIKWCLYKWRSFLHAGNNFTFGRGTIFFARDSINIGANVYFGRYCNVETDMEIGDCVLIANNVAFVGRNDHTYSQIGVPIRFSTAIRDDNYHIPLERRLVKIGDDVWIGYGAIVYSGVIIGDGAVIAAGSVVIHDIEPFSISAGIPAKKVGERFDTNDRDEHMAICHKRYGCFSKYLLSPVS